MPDHEHVLGLFRIIFGLFMAYEIFDYFQIDLVKNAYFLARVQLTCDFS
jgi:hypothetical protein